MWQLHKIEFKINIWGKPCNFYSRYLGILPLDRSRAIEPRGPPVVGLPQLADSA